MKLHLPGGLLAIISACIIGAGNAHALSVWEYTNTTTFDTHGENTTIGNFSYNSATGEITGTGLDTSDFTFVLNNKTLKDNTADAVNVVYVTGGSNKWGFNATDSDLIGRWNNGNWTDNSDKISVSNITQSNLSQYANSEGKIELRASITGGSGGTYLYAPSKVTSGSYDTLYGAWGLRSSDTITMLTVDENYIDSVTIHTTADNSGTSNVTVRNENKLWINTYATVARVSSNETVNYGGNSVDATLITARRLQVTGGASGNCTDVSSHGGDLVVGKAGQLFLQTWGTGAIELSNNIILGSSTRQESGQSSELQNVALRFGNDSYTVTLNGNITLVENAIICGATANNTKEVHIKGTVTSAANSGTHNLTISQGKNLHFEKGISNIGTLTVSGGSQVTISNVDSPVGTHGVSAGSVTISGGSQVTIGHGASAASVTISGNSQVTIDKGVHTTGGFTVQGNDSIATINGNTNIEGNLTGNNQATINLGAGTHTIANLDASNGSRYGGNINIKKGAQVTVSGKIWLRDNSSNQHNSDDASITIEQGASLTKGMITISGKEGSNGQASSGTADASTEVSTASITNTGTDEYSLAKEGFTISHAAVTLTTADVAATNLNNVLTDVELTHSGTGILNVFGGNGSTDNANTLTAITASGTLNILKSSAATIATVTLGDSATVGVYTGDTASGDMGTLTATSLTAGTGASVAGTLTLNGGDNSLLSLGSALAIQGALNLDTTGGLIGLDGSVLSGLGSDRIDLFTGVTAFNVGGEAYSEEVNAGTIFSSAVFDAQTLSNTAGGGAPAYVLGYEGNTVYLKASENVPEPATATLSLLALAGLVARRRRKLS